LWKIIHGNRHILEVTQANSCAGVEYIKASWRKSAMIVTSREHFILQAAMLLMDHCLSALPSLFLGGSG
jgi:hypothetical protein